MSKTGDGAEEITVKITKKKRPVAKREDILAITKEISAATAELAEKPRRATPAAARSARRGLPAVLRVLASILFLAGAAALIAWFTLWRTSGGAAAMATFASEKPALVIYSGLVVFSLVAIAAALTWRPFLSSGLMFIVAAILCFANNEKLASRDTPLFPEELAMAGQTGTLAGYVDGAALSRLIIGIILILIGSILLEHYARKLFGRNKNDLSFWSRTALIPRITFTLIALAGFSVLISPVLSHDEQIDWLGDAYQITAGDRTATYNDNGFIIGFLYYSSGDEIKIPKNYNPDTMSEIAKKYEKQKSEDETERKPLSEIAENVIIILDETFYDPEILSKYYPHSGGDVVPNLHRIFQEYPSGYMYSPEYGGGTANIEFEVLTGYTNFWASTTPYSNVIPYTGSQYSIARLALANDYETSVIHSYTKEFYKRDLTYPILGFNSFLDQTALRYNERDSKSAYINDRSLFRHTLETLKENHSPQFITLITMQNHSPYAIADYPQLDYIIKNDDDTSLIESNFQSIHNADAYLGEFIDGLNRLNEKTVVLWFGDHAAGILDQYVQSSDRADRDIAHLTPYFIYANFDIKSDYDVSELADARADLGLNISLPERLLSTINLPLTSPNCLQNTFLNLLGAEKPSRLYILDEVCKETPILTRYYLRNNDKLDSIDTSSGALRDYELMVYDALFGLQYWPAN